jgi:hypothetical protein
LFAFGRIEAGILAKMIFDVKIPFILSVWWRISTRSICTLSRVHSQIIGSKEDVSYLGASGRVLDSFLLDSIKVFIDGMEYFVHASMKFDMHFLD